MYEEDFNPFMVNLPLWKKSAVEQAAEETGYDIYIGPATYRDGEWFGVYHRGEFREYGPFWQRYRELVDELILEDSA